MLNSKEAKCNWINLDDQLKGMLNKQQYQEYRQFVKTEAKEHLFALQWQEWKVKFKSKYPSRDESYVGALVLKK